MAEKQLQPEPSKAKSPAGDLEQQYEELCRLRAELARLQAVVPQARRRTSKIITT
jgi:phage terminase Nu1 subunit (DNA packaging protein)